ncbi:MAG: hypothetical protein K8R23_15300 [Chthoniobacter sp.]|nr:hypothetical protein [Chthoniobacter sp.]
MNTPTTSPTDYVDTWLATHQHRIGSQKRLVKSNIVQKLCVWFETPMYLIDITAWDSAFCLDIIAINKQTDHADYLVCGSCEDHSGLTERLESFTYWLTSNDSTKVA